MERELLMQVICSYCHKVMEEDTTHADGDISHGMCELCHEYFSAQWNGMNWDEYLNRFDQPVVLLNGDRRIVAVNERSKKMLNSGDRDVVGLLGGEAMECVYARLPEGCGKTLHCAACTIRIVTERAISTRESFEDVPACLSQDTEDVQFLISASRLGSLVQIVVKNSDVQGDGE